MSQIGRPPGETSAFDHTSDPNFVHYYQEESLSPQTYQRFKTVRDKMLKLAKTSSLERSKFAVLDIGCGTGSQCHLWAELGHDVTGIDVNAALIDIARSRAAESKLEMRFEVGSATRLPFENETFDVCLLPELLEHVEDWESCLSEACRVLKPSGLLYLSTTNLLCPVQQEFNLPLYSWYPGPLKHRYERLAVTTRPELANYARYPAVHWFTFRQLAKFLKQRGLDCLDRFDMIDVSHLAGGARVVVTLARWIPLARWFGQVLTPTTILFAVKKSGG